MVYIYIYIYILYITRPKSLGILICILNMGPRPARFQQLQLLYTAGANSACRLSTGGSRMDSGDTCPQITLSNENFKNCCCQKLYCEMTSKSQALTVMNRTNLGGWV